MGAGLEPAVYSGWRAIHVAGLRAAVCRATNQEDGGGALCSLQPRAGYYRRAARHNGGARGMVETDDELDPKRSTDSSGYSCGATATQRCSACHYGNAPDALAWPGLAC